MPDTDEGQISYYDSQYHRRPRKGRAPSGFSGPSRDSEGMASETRGPVWALNGGPVGLSMLFLRVMPVVCVAVVVVCFGSLCYPVRLKRCGRGE